MKKLYPIITATSLVFIASLAGYHLPINEVGIGHASCGTSPNIGN